jgi:NADH-quinone oxidoreductase subunit G
VDLCPVGALLDKDFLFKQRVWLLKQAPSISPADSGGENIYLEHNEGVIYRVKPRYNADVNQWWISDDTRYSYKPVHDEKRLRGAKKVQYGTQVDVPYGKAIEETDAGLKDVVAKNGPGSLYALLSPMMACEEAWLLGQYIRGLDPQALLILGPVPTTGQNETFKNSLTGKQTFVIQAEKVPNAAGLRRVLGMLGGPQATFDQLASPTPEMKKLKGGWSVGGYLSTWLPATVPPTLKTGFKVVQDILPTSLTDGADALLPSAAWAEKDGAWENYAGRIQAFTAAVAPLEGARRDGDVYYKLLGRTGLYNAEVVRQEMGEPFAAVKTPADDVVEPAPEFVEL